jgi:hemerythrin-like domain-containing protein
MKRVRQLQPLSNDHHQGLVLAKRAMHAADEGKPAEHVWAEMTLHFSDVLEPHFQIEEETLAEPLRSAGETELVERLEREHAQLRAFFRPGQARGYEELKAFGELLKAHIRFEERELFEAAQEKLSEEQLQKVEAACR